MWQGDGEIRQTAVDFANILVEVSRLAEPGTGVQIAVRTFLCSATRRA